MSPQHRKNLLTRKAQFLLAKNHVGLGRKLSCHHPIREPSRLRSPLQPRVQQPLQTGHFSFGATSNYPSPSHLVARSSLGAAESYPVRSTHRHGGALPRVSNRE